MKSFCLLVGLASLIGATGARAAVVVTATSPTAAGLGTTVDEFRTLVSQGGTNNGVGGGLFPNGRREVAWDVASLDPFQVPAAMPGDFFRTNSLRGLELTTPGSLRVSGRAASGSYDVLFSTLNPTAAAGFQTFSPERLLAAYGATTVVAEFYLPSAPSQRAVVQGFGALFADVSLFGPTRLEAFGRSGRLLATVAVPATPNGLSFAGLWIDGGEWIDQMYIHVGEAGIENTSDLSDIVALDDFIYSEPQLIPEPETALLLALGVALAFRRRQR
ncbi:MAG: PEP-CTERM sorting domain-containing protein [Verrucomicrobiales bacterium]